MHFYILFVLFLSSLLVDTVVAERYALILSGQPRFYNSSSYVSIKDRIIDQVHPDVFFHTWFHENDIKTHKTYSTSPWTVLDNKLLEIQQNTLIDLVKLYDPLLFSNNSLSYPVDQHDECIKSTGNRNIAYQMFSLAKANELKQIYERSNHFKYDFVIITRFDCEIKMKTAFRKLEKNYLYDWSATSSSKRFPNPYLWDNFLIMSSEQADVWTSVYYNLKNLCLNTKNNAEELLWLNWQNTYNYDFDLLRDCDCEPRLVRNWQ